MADMAVTEKECVELLNQYLIFDGDEFLWKGTCNQLKRYFAEDLKLSGNWSSPSGGVWLFSTSIWNSLPESLRQPRSQGFSMRTRRDTTKP